MVKLGEMSKSLTDLICKTTSRQAKLKITKEKLCFIIDANYQDMINYSIFLL
jgi:hypothetical protein